MAKVQVDLHKLSPAQQELRRPLMNGYNFTTRLRMKLADARAVAGGLRHNYIAPEHLLLALVDDENCVAAIALANLGGSAEQVRTAVLDRVTPPSGTPGEPSALPFTSRGKKSLELAMSEARSAFSNTVG